MGRKLVTLQFDDGLKGVHHIGVPLLNKLKGKPVGTIALIGRFLDRPAANRLTWQEVEILRDMGWEMQCHTYNHVNITTLTADELQKEYEKVDNLFFSRGWERPTQTYLPGRNLDGESERITRMYRPYIINTYKNSTTLHDLYVEGISHKAVDGDTQTQARQNNILKSIDELNNGEFDWLIIRGHDIRDEPGDYQYAYKTIYFKEMLEYIDGKRDIKFVTVGQGLRLLGKR